MTNAPRFLKPKKLGLSVESWLRHEVLGTACTANVCLYFLGATKDDDAVLSTASFMFGSFGAVLGTSWLVVTAVSINDAMIVSMVSQSDWLRRYTEAIYSSDVTELHAKIKPML